MTEDARRPRRPVYDLPGHAHFLTFSCFHGLPLLERDQCKLTVLRVLDKTADAHEVAVLGYVVMPDHVHVLVLPCVAKELSTFIQQWKRLTSFSIRTSLGLGTAKDTTPFGNRVRDGAGVVHVWQKRYYDFNVTTPAKAIEKLEYMHRNPVRAGLVEDPYAWEWSSAAALHEGRPSLVKLTPID
ncbi:MAG: transposase [Candidatus Methylomirabilis sp.]|nr:transposase [Deltaproteobacteria bacterium]